MSLILLAYKHALSKTISNNVSLNRDHSPKDHKAPPRILLRCQMSRNPSLSLVIH